MDLREQGGARGAGAAVAAAAPPGGVLTTTLSGGIGTARGGGGQGGGTIPMIGGEALVGTDTPVMAVTASGMYGHRVAGGQSGARSAAHLEAAAPKHCAPAEGGKPVASRPPGRQPGTQVEDALPMPAAGGYSMPAARRRSLLKRCPQSLSRHPSGWGRFTGRPWAWRRAGCPWRRPR